MASILCVVDDKYVPLYRVIWVSAVPHFCGAEDCMCEGLYEVRLEQGEAVWATRADRDRLIAALDSWQGGLDEESEDW